MKIIGHDNHDSEAVAESLWIDGIPNSIECRALAERICEKLNANLGDGIGTFYRVVKDDHALWGGMSELV